jgi:hypothetical protein
MIQGFIKSYEASAAATPRRIARFSDVAASQKVADASANTQALIGVFDGMGADAGGMADVHLSGLASVELGGTVAAGAPLTSDASGRAIAAVAASATQVRIIGFAHAPGVVGDIVDVWLAPGLLDRA